MNSTQPTDTELAEKARQMKIDKELAKTKEAARVLKKKLKIHPKSTLINIIFDYASRLQEMQQAARQLLEENKQLKGIKNEDNKDNNPSTDTNNIVDNSGEESK